MVGACGSLSMKPIHWIWTKYKHAGPYCGARPGSVPVLKMGPGFGPLTDYKSRLLSIWVFEDPFQGLHGLKLGSARPSTIHTPT